MNELENTVVHCKTKDEYDELMRLYEDGGWEWMGSDKPMGCVISHDLKKQEGRGYKIISLAEFKAIQGLDQDFKVGDRVKIVKNDFASRHNIGHVGEIIEIDYSWARVSPMESGNWSKLSELEKVEPDTIGGLSRTTHSFTDLRYRGEDIIKNKGGLMSKLRSIPKKVKRMLNPNYRSFYKLGWVEEDLTLNSEGSNQLEEFLLDKYEGEFGKLAGAEVKRIEKKEAK